VLAQHAALAHEAGLGRAGGVGSLARQGEASLRFIEAGEELQHIALGLVDAGYLAALLRREAAGVLDGLNLVQLRASGTINGTGNYQILVTARDNGNSSPKTDAVRIRIVDASGGSIIYDNQPGAPETAEPAILITGGNLVVHN
jgi:hypothetical protein